MGDPSYGGNKGQVGWKLVGFEPGWTKHQGRPQAGLRRAKDAQHPDVRRRARLLTAFAIRRGCAESRLQCSTRWLTSASSGRARGARPVAFALGRAGYKVVMLEKGAWYQEDDFVHDEILNSRRNFFMPLPVGRAPPVAHRPHAAVHAQQRSVDRQLRGRRHGAHERLLLPTEAGRLPLEERAQRRAGQQRGSTGPSPTRISHRTTTRPRQELGVSGNAVPHPFLEPRNQELPAAAARRAPSGVGNRRGVPRQLGWHAIPTARAILSHLVPRSRSVRVLHPVRQLRLRARRQGQHLRRHSFPAAHRHRQCGAAAQVHGEGDHRRSPRASPRASSTSTKTGRSRSSRRDSSS